MPFLGPLTRHGDLEFTTSPHPLSRLHIQCASEVFMDTKNKHESDAAEELDKAAEDLESQAEERDEERLVDERDEQEDLNQGMQTGTHDAFHPGIKWGSSYRIKESKTNPKKPSGTTQKD